MNTFSVVQGDDPRCERMKNYSQQQQFSGGGGPKLAGYSEGPVDAADQAKY